MNSWCHLERELTLRQTPTVRTYRENLEYRTNGGHHILFVHGYNVTTRGAVGAYKRFRDWLEFLQIKSHVLELHWPGDVHLAWLKLTSMAASMGAYPFKIGDANDCGIKLGNWLNEQPADSTFTLVGHSLGCRVVLQAIERLREIRSANNPWPINHVCLMAAAVPVQEVGVDRMGPRSREKTRWRVLHSRGDLVLHSAFHAGQTFARGSIFSEAVGRHGNPADIWTDEPGRVEMCQGPWFYGHGDYWAGGPKEPWRGPEGGSARHLAHLMGRSVSIAIDDRPLAMLHQNQARELPDFSAAEDAELPER